MVPGFSGILFHAIPTRFPPSSWTAVTIFPGNSLPITGAELFAVVTAGIKSGEAVPARLHDDLLVFRGFEGFAVVAGAVGGGGAGIALDRDGGLGEDGGRD